MIVAIFDLVSGIILAQILSKAYLDSFILIFVIGILNCSIIAGAVILIIGIEKKRPEYIKFWIWLKAITILLFSCISILVNIIGLYGSIELTIILIIVIISYIYFVLAIRNFCTVSLTSVTTV
ncbi:hypothetical protein ACFFRR_000265 [Megaselia abdita]